MSQTQARLTTLLERIDRALLAEIEVVREGRFKELQDVQRETLAAVTALDGAQAELRAGGVNAADMDGALGRVRDRAQQAQGLIGAALNGARRARSRVEALIQSDGEVGAYDRTGGQIRMNPAGSPYRKTL